MSPEVLLFCRSLVTGPSREMSTSSHLFLGTSSCSQAHAFPTPTCCHRLSTGEAGTTPSTSALRDSGIHRQDTAQRPIQLLYQSVLPAAALCCHCAFLSHTPSFTSVMGRGASVVHTGMLSSDTAHRIRGEMEHGTFDGHTQAYTATQSTDHLLCHGLG